MNKTVLLVEDFENDIILMRRFWKKEGVKNQLHVVTDGRQALDYLAGKGPFSDREQFPLPCLVLLDLKLPHVMGLDVLAWIRTQSPFETLPVLILSTSSLGSDIDQAYRLGANAYLVKPADVAKLAELVRLIRDFWLGANHFSRLNLGWHKP
ncbi:MAG TPA: response regulator, partial [Verrucomicrobiae bacterium]|nr:response regulator [Verrucomicrobiae bacterium]